MSNFFGLLFLAINFSVIAEQQVFFKHDNKEHAITYYGDADNPSGIVLNMSCNPSYCDPADEFVKQFTSFINAFKNDEVNFYSNDNTLSAEINDFDINDAFDRLVENSIEDFFYKVYTSIKCMRGTAGPAGETVTTQLICYIPK